MSTETVIREIIRYIGEIWKRLERLEAQERPFAQRGCRVYRSTTQSIANNSLTAVSFDSEVQDTDECWASGAPTRLYAQHAGYYMAGGQLTFDKGQMGQAADILLLLRKNGSTYLRQQLLYCVAGHDVALSVTDGFFWMDAGDYIEVCIRQVQASGSASINLSGATATYQQFNNGWLQRIA